MKLAVSCVVMALMVTTAEAAIVIIDSTPRGAEVKVAGEVKGKTPCRLVLPEGQYRLDLAASDYKPYTELVLVERQLIQRTITLQPKTYPVDIVFEDIDETGWAVFDGKRLVVDAKGQIARVPLTVHLLRGKHKIILMKPGFANIALTVDVDKAVEERIAAVVDAKPKKGQSNFEEYRRLLVEGEWFCVAGQNPPQPVDYKLVLNSDGTLRIGSLRSPNTKGTWSFNTGKELSLRIAWAKVVFTFRLTDSETLVGNRTFVRVPPGTLK